MADQASEKKKWEVGQCQLVAAEMNESHGTDYEAYPSDTEPADVSLRSKSGVHPPIPVQVVSIPLDFRHRDDKDNVEKIKKVLTKFLPARGLKNCLVGIILSGKAEMHGMKPSLLGTLMTIIVDY